VDAVAKCRKRCWKYNWAIKVDIQTFFDTVPWDLMIKAVEANTDQRWIILYIDRWLRAPLQHPDGVLQQRERGTPQGSAVSPVLANLFLHYAFDAWMSREFPGIRFERYVDDAVVHCSSQRQALMLRAAIGRRMEQLGVRLHPSKSTIVYCKDSNRRDRHQKISFTFLGYTFRPRQARDKRGRSFTSFLPAMSRDKLIEKGREVRR
jgi:group II intron reverse transcriptase/maturase